MGRRHHTAPGDERGVGGRPDPHDLLQPRRSAHSGADADHSSRHAHQCLPDRDRPCVSGRSSHSLSGGAGATRERARASAAPRTGRRAQPPCDLAHPPPSGSSRGGGADPEAVRDAGLGAPENGGGAGRRDCDRPSPR